MPGQIDILYICDWLPPDFGAVGQYSLILARNLAAEGEMLSLAGSPHANLKRLAWLAVKVICESSNFRQSLLKNLISNPAPFGP